MKTAKMVFNQISNLTSDLVGTALCNDQNFPIHIGQSWDDCQIEIPNINVSTSLKHKPYRELFHELERARSFNLKLLDEALSKEEKEKTVRNGLQQHEILQKVVKHLETDENLNLMQIDLYLVDLWESIGMVVFTWTCAPTPHSC